MYSEKLKVDEIVINDRILEFASGASEDALASNRKRRKKKKKLLEDTPIASAQCSHKAAIPDYSYICSFRGRWNNPDVLLAAMVR